MRSVFNTVLRSGREGRARDSLVMSFQLGAQNHRLNTKSNTESNISIKLHRPKSGIEHSIQYGIKSQYFNRICLQAAGRLELSRPLDIECPMVIMHGMEDEVVPHEMSLSLAKSVRTRNVDLVLRKDGDHRLSREEDLQLMTDCLDRLIGSL